CTALVMDYDVNIMTFDAGCSMPSCNVDGVATTPPLGSVTFTVYDKDHPLAPGVFPPVASYHCTDTTNPAIPATTGHLTQRPPMDPGYFPTQPIGQQWQPTPSDNPFASWCSGQVPLAPGHWQIKASFDGNGPSGPHLASNLNGGFDSEALNVDVNP